MATNSSDSRALAAITVERVVEGEEYVQRALDDVLGAKQLDKRDAGLATLLTYGTLTWLSAIDRVLNELLRDGIESVPASVRNTLRVGAFQLLFMKDAPADGIVVHATVESLPQKIGRSLRGLSNGVLRNVIRRRTRILADMSHAERHGLPTWLFNTLRDAVGAARARTIMEAWNGAHPTWIRVRKSDDNVVDVLAEEGHSPEPAQNLPGAISVRGRVASSSLFPERIAIQDIGAQIAGIAGIDETPELIIDACAGLGGKSVHFLDRYPESRVIAVDNDGKKLHHISWDGPARRLKRVRANLSTDEGVEHVLQQAGRAADHVFVDAPCTALGTLGRHPEVRWRKQPEDIRSMSEVQRAILSNSAKLVRPGGTLTYCVCTFSVRETDGVVDGFLARNEEFEAITSNGGLEGVEPAKRLKLWPDEHGADGFYYAFFRRKPQD